MVTKIYEVPSVLILKFVLLMVELYNLSGFIALLSNLRGIHIPFFLIACLD